MNDISITLPWPPVELSPNRPGHWAKKAKAKKAYRTACRAIVEACPYEGASLPPDAILSVSMRFHAPSRRRYDWDNLLARMKAGLDGISDALGVDDSIFRPSIEVAEPCPPNGHVVVVISIL
jgi:crossover junction endodeoxyribonuclease RusA